MTYLNISRIFLDNINFMSHTYLKVVFYLLTWKKKINNHDIEKDLVNVHNLMALLILGKVILKHYLRRESKVELLGPGGMELMIQTIHKKTSLLVEISKKEEMSEEFSVRFTAFEEEYKSYNRCKFI